jgi:Flp pilus assembly protein TadB
MFEDLKKNISQEKMIIADIKSILSGMRSDPHSKPFYGSSLSSLLKQLKMLNDTVPDLLREHSPLKKFTEKQPAKEQIVRMSYVSPATKEKSFVTLNKKDKLEYLQKLKLSTDALSKINKIKKKEEIKTGKEVKPNLYAKYSNKYFRSYSEKLAPQFEGVSQDLKKGNVPFLITTYLSMALMTASIAFIAGIVIFIFLIIINLANVIFFWIPFALLGLTFTGFYLYPAGEAGNVQKMINQELPFATIHMAAIAGSNIEPTKIFKIISSSREYPFIGREIKKIIIQTNVYGYDLVTSLKNVALRTPNKRLSELFSGLATNISTGGELKTYLEKKAENFLLDYKLERQRYTDLSGTFMDIYISLLITAPLVLMMMFIVMNVVGMNLGGMDIGTLTFISIGAIILINIIFIAVINLKQPSV